VWTSQNDLDASSTIMARIPLSLALVFAIIVLTGSQCLFMMVGTFSMASLRGGGSYFTQDDYSYSVWLERRLNRTIEEIVHKTEKSSNNGDLLALMKRLESIDEKLHSSNDVAKREDIVALQERLTLFNAKVTTHEDSVVKRNDLAALKDRVSSTGEDGLVALGERASSLKQRFQTHEQASVNMKDLVTLRELVSSADEKIQSIIDSQNTYIKNDLSFVSNNETFCVPWNVDTDAWWTHNPDWHVSHENDTHYCFSLIEDSRKAQFFRDIYQVQFQGNCSNVLVKKMTSSGFAADMRSIIDGLNIAKRNNKPFQLFTNFWQYVSTKDGQSVCPRKDMFCYFLNLTNCDTPFKKEDVRKNQIGPNLHVTREPGTWFREYATRQQTWLRREVYLYSTQHINITTPCMAMHVRRADVVLHNKLSRKYHPISEYIEAMIDAEKKNSTRNILLFTDDHNAISEALVLYPQYNWMYFDRPRHKGSEGGFENQVPSQDPKFEVIVLLSIFRAARRCSGLVYSNSGLAEHIRSEMEDSATSSNTTYLDVNLETGNQNIKSPENRATVNVSRSYNIEAA